MKNQKQEQARDLYLQSDLSQTQIAEILSIDRKTLYLWIRNNHWDKMKVAARQAPAIVHQDIYNHISAINTKIYSRDDHMPSPQEVDMLRKLFNMVKAMDTIHLGGYLQSFQDLITFISEFDRELSRDVRELANNFVSTVLQNEHKQFHTETMYEVIERIKQEESAQELHDDLDEDLAKPEEAASDTPPSDPAGNDGKLENNTITPPQANTDAPKQTNDNMSINPKFPKTDFRSQRGKNRKHPRRNQRHPR